MTRVSVRLGACLSVGLPQRQDAHALSILVFPFSSVLALLLLVRLAQDTANVLAVDLQQAVQLHRISSIADSLPELLEKLVGCLVLNVELAGEVQSSHALCSCDVFPHWHDDLLERQLPVCEDGSGRHRELGAAFRLRTAETATPDAVRLQATATRAIGLSSVVSPPEVDEHAVGIVLLSWRKKLRRFSALTSNKLLSIAALTCL